MPLIKSPHEEKLILHCTDGRSIGLSVFMRDVPHGDWLGHETDYSRQDRYPVNLHKTAVKLYFADDDDLFSYNMYKRQNAEDTLHYRAEA
jgi:hypothetical protein